MTEPVFLLSKSGKSGPFAGLASKVSTSDEARAAFLQRRARWIAPERSALELLWGLAEPKGTWHRLLVLHQVSPPRRELLNVLFRVVVAPDDGVKLLAPDELEEVLGAEHPEDYFIGGIVDEEDGRIILYRGDLDRLVVPLSWFKQRGRTPKPDFRDFEVTDTGQTLRFGQYEAAADAALYEFDSEARRRMKAREREQDHSLGGSIRRLRVSKHLSRQDFPGVDAKTVARIERGEVDTPQQQTLDALAQHLGVPVEDLGSY